MKLRLSHILAEILDEQDSNVLEFPNQNFTVSMFPSNKKLVFLPQFHDAMTENMRTYIVMIKEKFRVVKINSLDDEESETSPRDDRFRGGFEVIIDPRENFDEVVNFLKELVSKEVR